jgi:hypothetical protein
VAIRPATESVSAIARTAMAVIRHTGSVRIGELAHQAGLGLRQFGRRCNAVRSCQRRGGPISPMIWAITIRCNWCTISADCPGTAPTPSAR